MKKIVVGMDLSSHAEHALAHAVGVARRHGAEVVMVMVDAIADVPPPVDPSVAIVAEHYGRVLQERLARDRKALGELRARWVGRGAEVSSLVVDGRAAERLTTVARELNADLIVVGSHGHTGVRRWLLGSVAEHVVRMASQRVLVARGEAPPEGYERAVIGTDFTPGAERAIEHAVPLLAPAARVDLVYAWGSPWTFDESAQSYDAVRSSVEAVLTDAAQRLSVALREQDRGGVKVQARLVERSPAAALTDVAADLHADLVVVGSHGRRGVPRLVLGSVAETTVRHARCSVLVSR